MQYCRKNATRIWGVNLVVLFLLCVVFVCCTAKARRISRENFSWCRCHERSKDGRCLERSFNIEKRYAGTTQSYTYVRKPKTRAAAFHPFLSSHRQSTKTLATGRRDVVHCCCVLPIVTESCIPVINPTLLPCNDEGDITQGDAVAFCIPSSSTSSRVVSISKGAFCGRHQPSIACVHVTHPIVHDDTIYILYLNSLTNIIITSSIVLCLHRPEFLGFRVDRMESRVVVDGST